jgi:hypothetical protein
MLADRRYVCYHVAIIALLPAMLLAVNHELFINPAGNTALDPWVYTGFFLSLPSHLQRFGTTYYATRLSWLLPGFAAHSILPPLAANYALHLAFFYALLTATYAVVMRALNRSAALIATLLVAWNPAVLLAHSWDYVDGAGSVFLVLIVLCVERAVNDLYAGRRWRWSFGAGAAVACLVVSNLALLALLPACGALLLLSARSQGWRSIGVVVGAASLGALATFALFALASHGLGGPWLFVEPSIRFGLKIQRQVDAWRRPDFKWAEATWLALPFFATVGAVVSLAARRTATPFQRAAQGALIVAVLTWSTIDLFTGSTLLRNFWYTSYLALLALIAIPLQGGTWPIASVRSAVVFELAALVVLLSVHAFVLHHPDAYWGPWELWLARGRASRLAVMTAATAGLGLVAVLGLQTVPLPHVQRGLLVAGLALSYAVLAAHWPVQFAPSGRSEFTQTVRAHRFIASQLGHQPFRIWSRTPTLLSPPYRSISATYLWGFVIVNEELPRLTEKEARSFEPATRLAILVDRDAEAQEAVTSMRAFGLDYVNTRREQFGQDGRPFIVIVGDVVSAQPGRVMLQGTR